LRLEKRLPIKRQATLAAELIPDSTTTRQLHNSIATICKSCLQHADCYAEGCLLFGLYRISQKETNFGGSAGDERLA
jgi:hypothetical protein